MIAGAFDDVFIFHEPVLEIVGRGCADITGEGPWANAFEADSEADFVGGVEPGFVPGSGVSASDADVGVVEIFDESAWEFGVPGVFAVREMVSAAEPIRMAVEEELVAANFEGAKADVVGPEIEE